MPMGVDNIVPINHIGWATFNAWWNPATPTFMGRYFGPAEYDHPVYSGGILEKYKRNFDTSNGGECKAVDNNVPSLGYILPFQGAPDKAKQRMILTGDAGWKAGAQDAQHTCDNITGAIAAGQLALPTGDRVMVYLDIEDLSAAFSPSYWSGWASGVWAYTLSYNNDDGTIGVKSVFSPAVYTYSEAVGNAGARHPRNQAPDKIRDGINTGSLCMGLMYCSPQPATPQSLTAAQLSTQIDAFGTWGQGTATFQIAVPVYAWQYAIGQQFPIGQGSTNQMDLDFGSDTLKATDYMLTIV